MTDRAPRPYVASTGSPYYAVVVAVFTGLVLLSNITATKGVAFGPIITDGGFLVFPLTYILGDVLSEVYGFAAAARAIVVGFVMQAFAAGILLVTVALPAADFYTGQESLSTVVTGFTGLAVAGLAGFAAGQTVNALVMVRIKARTRERHLWARLLGSTAVGQLADTVVFCTLAARVIGISTWRDFAVYVALGWLYKTAVEVVLLPVTYRVVAALKHREPSYGLAA